MKPEAALGAKGPTPSIAQTNPILHLKRKIRSALRFHYRLNESANPSPRFETHRNGTIKLRIGRTFYSALAKNFVGTVMGTDFAIL
jgi:hypothetical protein